MHRIGLADDHPVVIEALQRCLRDDGRHVAFSARSGDQLIETMHQQPCDALVTDYAMGNALQGSDGLILVERVMRRFPDCRLVVFTMLQNPAVYRELLALGVDGIVSKNDEIQDVLRALRAIEAGVGLPYQSASVRGALQTDLARPGAALPSLSQRELDVVRLFAQGQTLDEIAANLGRAKTTVATHKKNAMDKLGVTNNTDLIRYAYDAHLA